MITKNIKKYLELHLKELTSLSEVIFRGIHEINNKPGSVYVFDFGTNEDAAYLDYINEEILSKEYYALSGDLQWNIYYVLVRDNIDDSVKLIFENDKSFARKMTTTKEGVLRIFEKIVFEGDVDRGVYDIWKEVLEKNGLDFMSDSGVTYVDGMKKVISGVKAETVSTKKKKQIKQFEIKKVDKLISWDKKRLPAKLPDFGKVNLISGPNAIGKTSLLEFIEMGICGGSFRNPSSSEKVDLKISFNNGEVDTYEPSAKDKYKSRDAHWYNSSLASRTNTLVVNFGRYNFYDADASYRMSHESDKENEKNSQKQLMSILSQIALGKEMNDLETRVKGYQDRLDREIKNENKSLNDTLEFIKNHQQTLKNLSKSIFDEKKSMEEILEKLKSYGWKYSFDDYKNGLSELMDDLTFNSESLNSFLENGQNLDVSDIGSLDKKDDIYKQTAKKIDAIDKYVLEKVKTKRKTDQDLLDSDNLISRIDLYSKLLQSTDLFNLQNYSLNSRKLIDEIAKIDHAHAMYVLGVDEISEKYLKENFSSFKVQNEESVISLTRKVKEVSKKISLLEEKQGTLHSLTEKIKQLGSEYVDSNKDLDKCPLCESGMTQPELKKRILKDIANLTYTNEIEVFKKDKRNLEKDLKEASFNQSALRSIFDLYEDLYPDRDLSNEKVFEVYELVTKKFDKLAELKQESKLLTDKLNKLKSQDITVEAFKKFNDLLLKESKLNLESNNLEKIKSWIQALRSDRDKLAKSSSKISKDITDKKDEVSSILKAASIKGSFSDRSYLNSGTQILIDLREEAAELGKFFNLDDVSSFKVLKNRVSALVTKCDEFVQSKREFEKNSSMRSNHESEIKKYEKNKVLLQSRLFKLSNAYEVLMKLQSEHGKSDALEDFFYKNIKSISDTYLRIHSPKEFVNLEYDQVLQSLYLTRSETLEKVSVSQISSGQRAALALSVFLTLNQNLKDGPKVILLDDPVIFADDLNVLSFFDYIRSLVDEGGRQIFFATANEKIASLFRRKFRVFEKDFVDINLDPSVDDEKLSA